MLNDNDSHGGTAVRQWDRLTAQAHQSLVVDFNRSEALYPSDRTIVELFTAQSERTPDSEAIRSVDQSLTYRQLNARTNQMAAQLRKLEVGPGKIVVIVMEHSVEVVCAMLGVLKAGAAYVPVDGAIPKERLAFMLKDITDSLQGSAPVLITQSRLVGGLPTGASPVMTLDADFASISEDADSNPTVRARPSDLAYLIYTSGSTGTPKGVMIEHRSLVNYIWWANQQYCRGERLTWPLFSSLAFDLTVTSVYTPLISGGRIVVYRDDPGTHSTEIFKVVEDKAADIVKLTPAHLAMIKDMNLRSTPIRKFIVGGEDFKTYLALDIARCFDRPVEIFNEYGPTEATVGCMIHRYDAEKDLSRSVPIGVPAANAGIYVLNEQFLPVPPGVIGEMYLAGDGLARGYFNRPELTEQAFLTAKDPRQLGDATNASDSTQATLRLYRTGDLARWSDEGRMEYLGRADQQVKVSGVRIELGEIEARLSKHPDVRECVVTVTNSASIKMMTRIGYTEPQADETDIDRLVAYFVSDKSPTVAELRAHLAKELPDYMLPHYFIRLEKLPLTSNGKINRKALPTPSAENIQPAHDFIRPNSETEEALAVIWTELLRVESIGISDDFFELGGHSLLAIRAVSRIRDVFGVDLPLGVLFERPTVMGLADAIDGLTWLASSGRPAEAAWNREEIEV